MSLDADARSRSSSSSADGSITDGLLSKSNESKITREGESTVIRNTSRQEFDLLEPAPQRFDRPNNHDTSTSGFAGEEDYSYVFATGMPVPSDAESISSDLLHHSDGAADNYAHNEYDELDPSPAEDDDESVKAADRRRLDRSCNESTATTKTEPSSKGTMPVCNAISEFLSKRGFPVVKLIASDVDTARK